MLLLVAAKKKCTSDFLSECCEFFDRWRFAADLLNKFSSRTDQKVFAMVRPNLLLLLLPALLLLAVLMLLSLLKALLLLVRLSSKVNSIMLPLVMYTSAYALTKELCN